MTGEYLQDLRSDVLRASFVPFTGKLASGIEANNKLDMERLERSEPIATRVINCMIVKARNFDPRPDLIVPVPNGANWLGEGIALGMGIGSVNLIKDKDTGMIGASPVIRSVIENHERILVVEDVYTSGTSTRKVMDLPFMAGRVIGVLCLWSGGLVRPGLHVPVEAIFDEPIEPMLPENSELWQYTRRQ